MEKQTSRIAGGGRIGVDPGIFFARCLSRTQEHHGVKKYGHVCLGMTAAQNSQLHPSPIASMLDVSSLLLSLDGHLLGIS